MSNQLNLTSENQIDLFDDEDDETLEFLLLEQSLQQENDDDLLYNNLRKQIEQISSVKLDSKDEQIKGGNNEKNNDSEINEGANDLNKKEVVLRTKKKISFDANSYDDKIELDHPNTDQRKFKINRPLTIFIPSTKQDLDLINHLTALGHDLENLKQRQIQLTPSLCTGYLWKESYSTGIWIKRYFVFDRNLKLFMYFKSFKNYCKQKEPNDVIGFEEIKNVYADHVRNVEKTSKYMNFSGKIKSRSVFIVKTAKRDLVLSALYPEVMRFWIDIIFTGVEAYDDFF